MRDYSKILSDMMARVTNDVDKREGSVVHTALAPVAAELVQYEMQHEYDLLDTFLGTATGQALDNRASDFGYKRKTATPSHPSRVRGLKYFPTVFISYTNGTVKSFSQISI